MMSVEDSPDYLRRSYLAGAMDYLTKPFSYQELYLVIRATNHRQQVDAGVCGCHEYTKPRDEELANQPDVFLEVDDEVWDTTVGKHAMVLRGRDYREFTKENWFRSELGFPWDLQYSDGTSAMTWGAYLRPWADPPGPLDEYCITCGDHWRWHFGHGARRPCRSCLGHDEECADFSPGGGRPSNDETTVVDLLAALRMSVERAKRREGPST